MRTRDTPLEPVSGRSLRTVYTHRGSMMGHMAVTPTPHRARDGSVSWKVRFRHAGRQTSETFPTERAARDFARLLATVGPDEAVSILDHRETSAGAVPTFGEWAREHIANLVGVEEGTRRRYLRTVERDMADLDHLPLDALTERTVAGWVRALERAGASGKTVRNKHGILSAILATAVRAGHIPANVAHGTRLPRTVRDEMVFLTHDEYATLLGCVAPRWQPLVATLAGTGLRWSEATALQVGDVSLTGGTVRVTRAWKYTAGQGHRVGPPKSSRSRRTVQLAPETVEVLRPLVAGRRPGEWVFTNSHGGPVRSAAFHEGVWHPAVDAADLGKRPRVHDLRHTCASWLIAAGLPLPYVQDHLGHESITTTVGTYGHLMPESRGRIAAALSSALTQAHPQIEP